MNTITNRFRLAAVAALVLAMATFAVAALLLGAQPALAGPVAWWKFDEAPGALQAADSVGAHPGTLSGGAAFVAGGISQNALSLDGTGLVNMGDNFQFTSGDFSILAWIQTADGEDEWDSVFVAKHRPTVVAGYILVLNMSYYGSQGKVTFWQAQPADSAGTSTADVNNGEWHQVAVSYHAGGSAELYVDGAPVEAAKPSCPIGGTDARFLIGGTDTLSGDLSPRFKGLIDQVQLYDHALTSMDVQYQFEHPSELAPEPATLSLLALGGLAVVARRRKKNGLADLPSGKGSGRHG